MAVRSSKQALAVARAQKTNTPGMCQAYVTRWFNAGGVGDVDGDKDADAVDGWLSEPKSARHEGDRNPPPGKPLAWKGGGKGYGHRALSDVNGLISTDMQNNKYKKGVTSTVKAASVSDAIRIIERVMGVQYLGWSETISGKKIPADPLSPVYVDKLRHGQFDSDSVKALQTVLKEIPLVGGRTLPVTGNFASMTKNEVSLWQKQKSKDKSVVDGSKITSSQAKELFEGKYTIYQRA